MGKFDPVSNSTLYQQVTVLGGQEFGAPAYFNGALYFGPVGGQLQRYTFTNATVSALASISANTFPYPGTTPSISANGSSNGSFGR